MVFCVFSFHRYLFVWVAPQLVKCMLSVVFKPKAIYFRVVSVHPQSHYYPPCLAPALIEQDREGLHQLYFRCLGLRFYLGVWRRNRGEKKGGGGVCRK